MDKNIEIWKGQALNIAKEEQILNNPDSFDLDLLFRRAKEIFYKAFDHDFFEWKPKPTKEENTNQESSKPIWVKCKKCGSWCNSDRFDNCKCGELIPKGVTS